MSENNIILRNTTDGLFHTLYQTTLKDCNKDEQYLENIIANNPHILKIENRQTGIYFPYSIFRQLSFKTPQERIVRPDILLLTASGHVIIVEVKLFGNPELNDRRVISQIVDYAGSFSSKTEDEILSIFDNKNKHKTWYDLITQIFNKCEDTEELSNVIMSKLKSGNIYLIIACDKVPIGLKELLKGISKQSSIEFKLDLLEITPYIAKKNEKQEIYFSPNKKLSTEIVARTSITVFYKKQEEIPSLEIKTTSIDDIQDNVSQINSGNEILTKNWSEEEIENYIFGSSNTFLHNIFNFTKKISYGNQIIAKGKKKNPIFACYIHGKKENDVERTIQLFNININANLVKIYLNMLQSVVRQDVVTNFKKRLKNIFNEDYDDLLNEPSINLELIEQHYSDFIEIIKWIINQIKIK